MDEPLSALDKKLREEMQLEIRRLHRELGVTMVFVTHDQAEAMTLSDRVAVFNQGRIEQLATPQVLYDTPANGFVSGFIGDNNVLPGQAESDGQLRLADGRALKARAVGGLAPGAPARLCVRPERLTLGGEGDNRLPGTVLDAIHQGDHWRVVAQLQGLDAVWFAKLAPRALPQGLAPGQAVTLSFGSADAWLFPA
jgi:putative spermidine/putrescine transport system ATP-binding protein